MEVRPQLTALFIPCGARFRESPIATPLPRLPERERGVGAEKLGGNRPYCRGLAAIPGEGTTGGPLASRLVRSRPELLKVGISARFAPPAPFPRQRRNFSSLPLPFEGVEPAFLGMEGERYALAVYAAVAVLQDDELAIPVLLRLVLPHGLSGCVLRLLRRRYIF